MSARTLLRGLCGPHAEESAQECWLSGCCGMQARDLADKALASFVVIQAALKRSRRLWAYCQREDLNQRMPSFAVSAPQCFLQGFAPLGVSCLQPAAAHVTRQ